jgi:NADPH-dependent curcumin reductase CurA
MTKQNTQTNRRVALDSRPHGALKPENFRLDTSPMPAIAEGQVLLRTVFLSLDPYMRGRMSDGPSYAPPVALDQVTRDSVTQDQAIQILGDEEQHRREFIGFLREYDEQRARLGDQ